MRGDRVEIGPRSTVRVVLALAIGCGLLAGCGGGDPAATPRSSVVGAPSAPDASASATPSTAPSGSPSPTRAPPAVEGLCANDYLPVVEGGRWLYERTVGNKVSRYHQVIEEAEEDGFSLLVDYGGGGDRELWTCSEPGLARVDQLRTGPRGGPPPPGVVSFHHRRAVGVTIPSDLDVGSSWKQVVTSFARFTVEGVTYTEKQVATTSYDVVGRESVTTLAGTFEALVVRTVAASHKTAPEFGNGIDTRVVSRYTQWWAPGVGMVRLASSEGPGATIDLVTFRFPDPS